MKLTSGNTVLAVTSFFFVTVAAVAQSESATGEPTKAETAQEGLTHSVQRAANSIDNFFSSDRHVWGDNKTRVTLRGNFDYLDDHGWEFNPEVRLFLALPGLNDRLRLVVNDDDDDGDAGGGDADDKDSNLALRFIGTVTDKYGITFDLGLSTRGDPSLQGFARVNLFRHWKLGKTWGARLENRVYWYTESEFRNDFRWYFEKPINDKFFFRSRTRLDWQQDKDSDWYPEQRFTLFQQINNRTALAYEVIANEIFFDDSPFDPSEILNPQERYTHYQARLRFRRNFKYPWLFYEVWPIAAWTEERDYEFTPAIRLRIEVVLGDPPKSTKLGMN